MIGYFTILALEGEKDRAGAYTMARAKAAPDTGLVAFLYLPPYMRTTQCGIGQNSRVFGVVDNVSGFGAALFGAGDADFGYFVDADVEIKKGLKVHDNIESTSGDIKADAGDVLAGAISLQDHVHPITTAETDPSTMKVSGFTDGATVAPAP